MHTDATLYKRFVNMYRNKQQRCISDVTNWSVVTGDGIYWHRKCLPETGLVKKLLFCLIVKVPSWLTVNVLFAGHLYQAGCCACTYYVSSMPVHTLWRISSSLEQYKIYKKNYSDQLRFDLSLIIFCDVFYRHLSNYVSVLTTEMSLW